MKNGTPGPWRHIGDGYIHARDTSSRHPDSTVRIAKVGSFQDQELLPFNGNRWKADARLIAAAPSLLKAAQLMIGSSVRFYEHNGEQKVELANERWVFAELLAAVSDALGEHEEAAQLRTQYPEPPD